MVSAHQLKGDPTAELITKAHEFHDYTVIKERTFEHGFIR